MGSSNELSRVAPANEHSGQADTAAEVTVRRSKGNRKGQLLSAFFSADKILKGKCSLRPVNESELLAFNFFSLGDIDTSFHLRSSSPTVGVS